MKSNTSQSACVLKYLSGAILFLCFSIFTYADEPDLTIATTPSKTELTTETLDTLLTFVELQDQLKRDIKLLRKELKRATSETERLNLKEQIQKAEEKLSGTVTNLENIAADTDLSLLRVDKVESFDLQKELLSLLEPALKEMKHATSDVRIKADLREKITYFEQRAPIVKEALENITILNQANKNKKIKKVLLKIDKDWTKQLVFIESELQAKRLQLQKLESQEESFSNKSENYFKNFFDRRGWTLIQVLLVIIGTLIVASLIKKVLMKYVKGYSTEHRSVQLRITDILHRFITFLLLLIGPMVVFYFDEDWVLFSLGVLLLIGLLWSLRQTIPRYWGQLELLLNIGAVREGERLLLDGIPWKVKHINMYSVLTNPIAGLTHRVDINELIDLRSRPIEGDEPWFPCRKGDWIILKDGVRGKVIGISMEMVQIVQRGGSQITYNISDFLSQSPKNLSKNFRLKETIGISYAYQKESTNRIVKVLEETLNKRIIEDGYQDDLLNLRVEFESAGESSLNIVVIADFKGQVADLYNRLRRAIQRWSVDACTENGWEIPFPQRTVHLQKLLE